MAKYNYTVTINGTSYANIQSLQVQTGRASVQDPFRAGTAVISGRSLVGFVKPLIGWQVLIYASGSLIADMRVADVSVKYGFLASEDTWEIRCEDALAEAGRYVFTDDWSSGVSCYAAAVDIGGFPGPDVASVGSYPVTSYASAQSFTNGNMLSVVQTLVQTEQGRVFGYGLSTIGWFGRQDMLTRPTVASFTDGTLTANYTVAKFDVINFASLADNYAAKVVVNPSGLAAQTSGTGARTFSMDSFDVSTSQAADLAAYVLNTLTVSTQVPFSLSCIAEQQSTDGARAGVLFNNQGCQVEIILRGIRYQCVIEGVSVSATPESSRFTYNLTSLTGTGTTYNSPIQYNQAGFFYND